jgi:hypothetical protein
VRINFIVLGFAAMNGLHIEGVSQDKGNPFLRTEVSQPIPRKNTFNADDHILSNEL